MNVPKLRFPEFRGAGEWEKISLNQVAKYCKQKNNFSELNRVLTNSAEYGILDQRDFFDKDIANQNNLDGYYIVKKGDYVYNPRISKTAPVGPISKNHIGDGVMSPLYTVFQFNDVNNGFYEHYFSTSYWHQYMRNVSSTGARHDRMAIANADFMGLPLPQTIAEEQQKIADCLSSLDELVTAETQTLEAYKQHKKGFMQQLFPQTGETTPRLRFPEFREVGEWEEKEFGDVALFSKGKGISKDDISTDGALPCIRYGQLYTHYKERITNVISRTNLSKDELVLSKANDVIIPASGETQIDIATASCVLLDGVALGGDLNIIRSSINGVFLSYYLNSVKKNEIAKLSQGISVVHLYASQLKSLKVNIPSDKEQQKIANCLSSLDDLITAQSQKIEALKLHKKGLMQSLFPNDDEVAI